MFDAHFHIIDPRFPLQLNQGYLPPAFTAAAYQQKASRLGITGGVCVSGSFQGTDTSYLVEALKTLGPAYCGVAELPENYTAEEILKLHENGVRGHRINLHRGGKKDLQTIKRTAEFVYDVCGWHTEFYISSASLPPLFDFLRDLPAVTIDHLGLTQEGFCSLLSLAETGVRVKASGFGRLNMNPAAAMRDIYERHPDVLMFGTDLPSTRAPRPFHKDDVRLIETSFSPEASKKILKKNAEMWYGMKRGVL
ncbi:amidohydrolase family protein [Alkalicoccus urumqiensis]|nr:amidohydrolase family protein [Alkalicoccus urumqiensis]